jgi:hypothetical protein
VFKRRHVASFLRLLRLLYLQRVSVVGDGIMPYLLHPDFGTYRASVTERPSTWNPHVTAEFPMSTASGL